MNKTITLGIAVTALLMCLCVCACTPAQSSTESTSVTDQQTESAAASETTAEEAASSSGTDKSMTAPSRTNDTSSDGESTSASDDNDASNNDTSTPSVQFGSLSVGQLLKFGTYEQDNNTANGAEAIEWRVLAIENNKALLTSTYALDCQKFNSSSRQGNDWETSELKTWLEGTFATSAFTDSERAVIDSGPFCMSVDEVNTYFVSDADRICVPTAYAVAQGVLQVDNACYWWLRSPGHRAYASFVKPDGTVIKPGFRVNYETYAVRPAMWVNL